MAESNPNSRLEAFCDGVFSIALTLLIIDIKVPPSATIKSTHDLWLALLQLLPSVLAFLFSFTIVLITWVNHHATLKLVDKSSFPFIYANGFMLLTVVVMPFPTALLGEFLFTPYAAPAVVLYMAVTVLQAIGWILLCHAALTPPPLTRNERATLAMRSNQRNGFYAVALYSVCAIVALWFPLAIAIFTSLVWIGWLIVGIRIKGD